MKEQVHLPQRGLSSVQSGRFPILLLIAGLILALTGALQAAVIEKGNKSDRDGRKSSEKVDVKNFGKINDHIYRGGQPEDDEYRQLAHAGIRTVIDLRNDAKTKARYLAEAAGMRYVNLKLDSKIPPTREESDTFLRLINDQTNWPVFVHCAGGRHRTGVLLAVYRMEVDGWSADQAYEEMKDFKFYSSWGHGDMKDFVFDYYGNLNRVRTQTARQPGTSRPRVVQESNQRR